MHPNFSFRWYSRTLSLASLLICPDRVGAQSLTCDLNVVQEAQTAYVAGRYDAAETGFRNAAKMVCGARQKVANWASLASTLHARAKLGESEEWFRKAMELAKQELNPLDQVWAQLLNGYALLDNDLGRPAEAESKFLQALSQKSAADANIRRNLAWLYLRMGRLDEAARLQEEALNADKNNPTQWINLAEIQRQQGQRVAAEQTLRQAVELFRQTVGEAHPHTITALSNLAQLLAERGDHKAAIKMMRAVVELWAQTHEASHPTYAKLLANLGALLFEKKNYVAAAPLFREALEINTAVFGAGHPEVGRNVHDLAVLHHAQKRIGEAESSYRRALEIYGRTAGFARERMDTLAKLGILYQQSRRLDDAENCYRQLLVLIPSAMPSEEAWLSNALESYEQLLRQRRDVAEAERVAVLAMRFRVRRALRQEKHFQR